MVRKFPEGLKTGISHIRFMILDIQSMKECNEKTRQIYSGTQTMFFGVNMVALQKQSSWRLGKVCYFIMSFFYLSSSTISIPLTNQVQLSGSVIYLYLFQQIDFPVRKKIEQNRKIFGKKILKNAQWDPSKISSYAVRHVHEYCFSHFGKL